MAINIHAFNDQYKKEYSFLYAHRDNVAGYDEAMEAFDNLFRSSKAFQKFVREFAEWRMDPISSDREAAAFMFACEHFGIA